MSTLGHEACSSNVYRTSSPTPETTAEIVAAGCLCWRPGPKGEIEVLIIHRPRYDDWSWPKGKVDSGETLTEAACREVREEVGLRARLGVPLEAIDYPVKGRLKHVYYWSAEFPAGARAEPDGKEVDRAQWVTPHRAAQLLSNDDDARPLHQLMELHQAGDLSVRPAILVRHAKAKPRASWSRAEGDRPLAATGKRQALAVQRLLTCWSPERVVSSPWLRCLSTVAPYARSSGLKVKERPAITEAAHKRSPEKAAGVIATLFEKDRPTVMCTHRPVLPTVMKVLSARMSRSQAAVLPDSDPYLSPGEMIVLQISRKHRRRVVSVEVIKPYDA